ncbi:LOW QUALITY PROTEIN: hypothetical protein V1478_004522 [Vespula squamosa]|uniref:Uncharacterized protein n=1 Tax=Vespula squamosa TaxID=30214 RepID=A0ABD2BGS8_VESSQ
MPILMSAFYSNMIYLKKYDLLRYEYYTIGFFLIKRTRLVLPLSTTLKILCLALRLPKYGIINILTNLRNILKCLLKSMVLSTKFKRRVPCNCLAVVLLEKPNIIFKYDSTTFIKIFLGFRDFWKRSLRISYLLQRLTKILELLDLKIQEYRKSQRKKKLSIAIMSEHSEGSSDLSDTSNEMFTKLIMITAYRTSIYDDGRNGLKDLGGLGRGRREPNITTQLNRPGDGIFQAFHNPDYMGKVKAGELRIMKLYFVVSAIRTIYEVDLRIYDGTSFKRIIAIARDHPDDKLKNSTVLTTPFARDLELLQYLSVMLDKDPEVSRKGARFQVKRFLESSIVLGERPSRITGSTNFTQSVLTSVQFTRNVISDSRSIVLEIWF